MGDATAVHADEAPVRQMYRPAWARRSTGGVLAAHVAGRLWSRG